MPAEVKSPPSKRELIAQAQQGSLEAMDFLVEDNLGLVRMLVGRFLDRGMEYEDLYQIGCIGLIKAIKNFNLEIEVQFSTYAVPVILGEIKRSFRDGGAIKVSRSIRENGRKVLYAQQRLTQQLGVSPTLMQLSEETGFPLEELAMLLDAMAHPISLSEKAGDGDSSLEDFFGVDQSEEELDRILIRQAMEYLNEAERTLISLRYFRGMTQSAAARVIGSSQVQVSRAEKKILQKLKHFLKEP